MEEREKLNEIMANYRNELSQAGDDLDKQESISRKYEKAIKDQEEKIAETEATLADYRASVGAASSGLEVFYKELGITAEEVAAYKAKINEAEGITQAFADAANEQYGMVDNLKQMWSEWSLRIGSALERFRQRRGRYDNVRADHDGHWARYADPLRHSDGNADTKPYCHGSSGMGGSSTLATVSGGDRGCNRHSVAALR